MAVAYRAGSTAGEASTWTLPSGWTQIGSDQRDFNSSMYLTAAYKRASSEGANYTFSLSTTTWRSAAMAAFSGVATGTAGEC